MILFSFLVLLLFGAFFFVCCSSLHLILGFHIILYRVLWSEHVVRELPWDLDMF